MLISCENCYRDFPERYCQERLKPDKLSSSATKQRSCNCPTCNCLLYRVVDGPLVHGQTRAEVFIPNVRVPASRKQQKQMEDAGIWPPEGWPDSARITPKAPPAPDPEPEPEPTPEPI